MGKAQLSINTIIIAVIGLVVLGIVIAIFTGKAAIFKKAAMGTCPEQGGECLEGPDARCPEDYPMRTIAKGCTDPEGKIEGAGPCCLPLQR